MLVRYTYLFVVLFNTVHPEDGRRRRPKHVGVASNVYNHKCICWFLHKTCLNARCGTHKTESHTLLKDVNEFIYFF
jgi:hypothetical protein